MQIDFHHAATYVLARFAGLSRESATTVAHAAQYVDDAVESGTVLFDNGAMYSRHSSAHKMLDYRNFAELASQQVWVPFHFLPGNGGLPAGDDPDGSFIRKLVCTPDSFVARELVDECIERREKPNGLHRLGITMHVYADTWAHQGFAGVSHAINSASAVTGPDGQADAGLFARLQNYFIGKALPLGHGTVLGNPDKPYLSWSYRNGLDEVIVRNNPRDYMDAADRMVQVMQRFAGAEPAGMRPHDRASFGELVTGLVESDNDKRYAAWLEAIGGSHFSFGAEALAYVGEGEGSWKRTALGEKNDDGRYTYRAAFLTSDWKYFHDALSAHRLFVVGELLPRFGICVA